MDESMIDAVDDLSTILETAVRDRLLMHVHPETVDLLMQAHEYMPLLDALRDVARFCVVAQMWKDAEAGREIRV